MEKLRRASPTIGLTCLVLGLAMLWYWPKVEHSVYRVFMARDIARTLSWMRGQPVWFGPELSGGGALPGPFSYWMFIPPLLAGVNWRFIGEWQLFVSAVGMAGLFWGMQRIFGLASAVIALTLALGSYQINKVIESVLTSSIVPPFHVVCALGLIYVFSRTARDRWRKPAWYAVCLSTALGMQLQLTMCFYAFAALLFIAFGRRLRLPPLGRVELMRGAAFFIAPFIPFLLWLACVQWGIAETPREFALAGNFFSGRLPQAARSIRLVQGQLDPLALLRGLRFLIFHHNFVLFCSCLGLVALVGSVGLFRPKRARAALEAVWRGRGTRSRALRVAILLTFFVGVVGFPWVLKLKPIRYILSFVMCLVMMMGATYAAVFQVASRPWRRVGAVACMFPVLLIVGHGQGWNPIVKHPRSSIRGGREVPAAMLEAPLQSIYTRTGWTFDEARRRIFRLGFKHSSDLSLVYETVRLRPPIGPERTPAERAPDGFFMLYDPSQRFRSAKFYRWLTRVGIPADIQRGIHSRSLEIGAREFYGEISLVPYWVRNPELMPPYFQNVGYLYDRAPEEELLKGLTEETGVKKLGDRRYVFYWNHCGGAEVCRSGMEVQVRGRSEKGIEIHTKILGSPLSKSAIWYSRHWSQNIVRPKVTLRCSSSERTRVLAERVGFVSNTAQQSTLLAPYERRVHIKCDGELRGLTVGYGHSIVYRDDDWSGRPGLTLANAPISIEF